ncbi:hypothetical protein [Salinibacter ruber]|uniref:hypothetical protein n=1 Tax=Salinibacter ruber TaxID=146919 RepID=UPI000E6B892E|nr:hypothetical protein [Salinibacter ruber]
MSPKALLRPTGSPPTLRLLLPPCLLFFLAWLSLACLSLACQPAGAQPVGVQNTSFAQEGNKIVVTYALAGSEEETYEVSLLLSTSGGRAFDYRPEAVSGDVGEDVRVGPGKTIRWRVLEDFPDGLQSQNVQLKVIAEEEGGNGWLYAIGSAVLAGGGGTAVAVLTGLLGGGSSGGGEGPEDTGPPSIPPPNGPPQ